MTKNQALCSFLISAAARRVDQTRGAVVVLISQTSAWPMSLQQPPTVVSGGRINSSRQHKEVMLDNQLSLYYSIRLPNMEFIISCIPARVSRSQVKISLNFSVRVWPFSELIHLRGVRPSRESLAARVDGRCPAARGAGGADLRNIPACPGPLLGR